MIAALPLALFAKSASADISVSGSGSVAYTDAGGNTSTTMGGGVSFAMSTTTDGGVTISASSGTSNDDDSAGSSSAVTGVTNLTFGFANGSISVGQDIGVADGVGKVGELAHYNDNQTGITNATGLGDDEGDGISASTSITVASASDDVGGTNMNEVGVAYTMAAAGGTLSLGFTGTDGDTAAKEGESMSAAFSTTLGGASVAVGYTGHDVNSKTAQQTDITISSSLGGGASIFAEYSNVSGTVATETATLSNNTLAVGTSVSF